MASPDSEIKFHSWHGFNKEAANPGDIARIQYRLNCIEEIPFDQKTHHICDVLDNYAYPQIIKMIHDGKLATNFTLRAVQLVMFKDESKNKILFNDDTDFYVHVKYRSDLNPKAGDKLEEKHIEQILNMYPNSVNNPDSGNVMLVKFKEVWYIACDLIYNLDFATKRCKTAKDMFNDSQNYMKKETAIKYIDMHLKTLMISIQCIFMLYHDPSFSLKETHSKTYDRFSSYTNNGNFDPKYSQHYKELIELRKNKLKNISGEDILSKFQEINKLTGDIIDYVNNILLSLTKSKSPIGKTCINLKFDKPLTSTENHDINGIIRKFPFGGIAASDSAEGETTVKIAFQIKCKDKFHIETNNTTLHEFLDRYVYPEIFVRVKKGVLNPGFKLHSAQFTLFGNSKKNEILLNENVRSMAHVKYKGDSRHQEGQAIHGQEIDDVLGLYPNNQVDQDAANVILFKCNGKWHISVDLIFDRRKTRSRHHNAKKFLAVSKYCLNEKLWNPFFDNLFSAMELSIQSMLLLHHNPRFSVKQTHDQTKDLFISHAQNGNIETKFADLYSKLLDMRPRARYLQNAKGVTVSFEEAEGMFSLTGEFVEKVEKLLEYVDTSKNPPTGEYLSIT
ncbi:MAG TPA: hypothetical protein VJS91_09230 [Nitrososphaeraceae archaeon]|nr:hypothetical protein [Nitrososphaeraceae archaeon]